MNMLFDADKPRPGTRGTVRQGANGKLIGEGAITRTVPVAFSRYACMDIGRGNGQALLEHAHVHALGAGD